MKLLNSKRFHSLAGIAISIALLVYLSWSVDWRVVGHELTRVHYIIFIPTLICFFLNMALRAWRWRYFLPSGRKAPFGALLDALMLGSLVTFILPLRAGEIVRPYLLSRKSEVPFPAGLISVVIERLFDLVAVLLSFGVVALLIPNLQREAYQGAALLSVMALAIFAVVALATVAPAAVRALVTFFTKPLPEKLRSAVARIAEQVLEGAAVLKNPRTLFLAALFTALVWLSNYLVYYVYHYLIHIEPTVLLAVTVAVLLALVVAAPSAPGFIGVYQVGCMWGFELFGYSRELGITFSIVTHLFQYVVLIAYGAYVMLRDNIAFSELSAAAERRP